ncbi:hypothetical protein C8Q73DRAFT_429842 [Cubamyces lactineus]|nr:hypothetical protein C8Q73DRAFT_429842 [Cubamyces lactineus]
MLVLHPNSQCDVCLDYYTANREPHAIGCGHVFCQRCLQSLIRPSCPLCRTPFQFSEVRRLHVDKATLPLATPQSSPPDLDSADRARQFQTQLTRIIRGGATASDMCVVQSELKPWLSTQRPEDIFGRPTPCCTSSPNTSRPLRMSSKNAPSSKSSLRTSVSKRPLITRRWRSGPPRSVRLFLRRKTASKRAMPAS